MDSRLFTAIQVVIGVPAVLILYIWGTERLVSLLPGQWQRRVRPWLWLGPALAFLGLFLIYPTIRTIIRSLYSRNERNPRFVGLDNYEWFFTNADARGALHQQRALAGAAHRVHGRARPADRRARRPGPVRVMGEEHHLPAAGDQHGRRGRDLEVHVRLPPARRTRRPAPSTRPSAPSGSDRWPGCSNRSCA